MIRIILADDHMIVRQGFQQLLNQQPDFTVVGEAGDGTTALRLVEELRPDILVLDVVMPSLSGLEVLELVQQAVPQTRVVVLSMHDDQAYVLQALRSGALAYLLKESSVQDLVQAIRVVMSGRHYLSAPLLEQIITLCIKGQSNGYTEHRVPLSSREREVLRMIGAGQDNRQIMAALAVKKRTVDTYRRRLIQKLGLQSQTALVLYALQHHRSLYN